MFWFKNSFTELVTSTWGRKIARFKVSMRWT